MLAGCAPEGVRRCDREDAGFREPRMPETGSPRTARKGNPCPLRRKSCIFQIVSLGNRVNKREGPRLLRPGPHAAAWIARALDGGDVLRLHALPALRRLVGDLLAFFKRLESAATYPTVMHEEVFATLIRGDKAVALILVEPLDCSLGHILKPTFLYSGLAQTKRPSEKRD